MWTGAAWRLSDSDTGWINLTLNAPFTSAEGRLMVTRRVGPRVTLQGALTSTGFSANTWHTIATLPADLRPSQNLRVPLADPAAGLAGALAIMSTGIMQVRTGASVPEFLYFLTDWLI